MVCNLTALRTELVERFQTKTLATYIHCPLMPMGRIHTPPASVNMVVKQLYKGNLLHLGRGEKF